MPIDFEYMFCFICREQCIKIILLQKKCGLFSFVFKKIIPNNTTLTFQKVDFVALPLVLNDRFFYTFGPILTKLNRSNSYVTLQNSQN